jgi:Protein of unknown function (DUF3592)
MVTAVLLALVGSVLVFLGVRLGIARRRRARESRQWPTARGRVARSEITIETGLDSKTHQARVQYEYVVLGQTYSGGRVSESVRRAPMQRVVEQYAPGTSVEVYYDPKRPGSAALEPLSPSLFAPVADVVTRLLFLLAGITMAVQLLPPNNPVRLAYDRARKVVTIGTRDGVRYRGDATEQDAKNLGEALRTKGYFQNLGDLVSFRKSKDGAVVSFDVKEGIWDKPRYVAAFEELGREIAPVVGVYPLTLELGHQTDTAGDSKSSYQVMRTIAIAAGGR